MFSSTIPVLAQTGSGWSSSGYDIHNSRWNSAESILGISNAGNLRQQWAFTTQNDVSATPSVDTAGNAVYFPDWSGNLFKLSLNNGAVIWSTTMTGYGFPAGFISRSTPTLAGNMVIFGASATFGNPNYKLGAYLVAVDAGSGNLIWKTEVDSTLLAIITSSPVVSNGMVYIGISSAQEKLATPTFRGSLVAVNQTTGQVLWQTYMVPPGYTGGPIWSSSPAVDITRNQVYVTTGNNYSVPLSVEQCETAAGVNGTAVEACQAANNYEDSIVALDLNTGAIKWGTKCSYSDAWTGSCINNGASCPAPKGADFDFGSGANFFTTTIKGVATDLVGAGQKSGLYWALNPATGAVVWRQPVGPGGIMGGIQWGTATDGQRIYAAVSNYRRASYTLEPSGMTWKGASWVALNSATGQFLWQVPDPGLDPIKKAMPDMALGPVSVANGVLYCADTAGLMFALNAATGATLWTFRAAGSVNAAPAVVNGTLYWGSGYHNFPASAPIGTASNEFYSFALPPPPAATTTSLISSINPSVLNQNVALTAAVTPSTATGTVTFLDGANHIGSGVLSGGTAAITTTALSVGSHALTAVYGGDANDSGSTSPILTQVVTPILNLTTTTLLPSPNPAAAGQTVTLAAAVTPNTATGTVNFFDGNTALGMAAVSNGAAAWQTSLSLGSHVLTAYYSGDAANAPSISAAVTETVTAGATMTSLAALGSPWTFGQSVTLAATISPATATGGVAFYDGLALLGAAPLANGKAALTTIILPSGAAYLRARYSGDAADLTSSSIGLLGFVNSVPGLGFLPAASQSAGANPAAVVVQDLNGDGTADLAIAGSAGVGVLLGNGDGTFRGPVNYPAASPVAVSIGDFNGDGIADIVAATAPQSVAVFLGNGDGTFQTATNYPAGSGPSALAIGDVNGDGLADLIVADGGGASIAILLGKGDGTFPAPLFWPGGNGPSAVALSDFNHDGKLDMAATNSIDNTVSVFLGNGDGTFQPALAYATGHQPVALSVPDINSDGKADILTANAADGTVSVLLGNGDGTFQSFVTYPAGPGPAALALGDFNGDGKADLALAGASANGSGAVNLLLGNGDGTFQPATSYAAGMRSSGIAVADFNGDGRADLAVANAGGNNLSVLLGKAPPAVTATALTSANNPAVVSQPVNLTATVTPATATGTVTFVDGTTSIGTATVIGGAATLSVTLLSTGSHSLTATYSGDNNDAASTSPVLTEVITSN